MNKSYCGFTLSLFIILFTSITGCKKDNILLPAATDYYIRFKVDGVQQEFKTGCFAAFTTADTSGVYACLLGGYLNKIGNGEPQISLLLTSRNAFTIPATYKDPLKTISVGGNKQPQAYITFIQSSTTDGYVSLGNLTNLIGPGQLFPAAIADAHTSINVISTAGISGSFTATIYKSTDLVTKKLITEGSFFVPKL